MDELIQRFYAAFNEQDGEAMAACYAPDAHFSDPVFRDLRGDEPGAMWKMLTSRGGDLRIELPDHQASGDAGSAHWIAYYTFAATGRPVVNDIRAQFLFRDGLIAEHKDDFSFWKWSRQALGPVGMALGWSPMLKSKVRTQARGQLDAYIANGATPGG
jgi:ketosteroid isomerase-like protein